MRFQNCLTKSNVKRLSYIILFDEASYFINGWTGEGYSKSKQQYAARIASNKFQAYFVNLNNNKYDIIIRSSSELDKILNELKFQMSDLVNQKNVKQLGKLLDVDALCLARNLCTYKNYNSGWESFDGGYLSSGNPFLAKDLNIVNVETGKVIYSQPLVFK